MKYRMNLHLVTAIMILAVCLAFPAGAKAQETPDKPAAKLAQDEQPARAEKPVPAEEPAPTPEQAKPAEPAPAVKPAAGKQAATVKSALPDAWVETLDWRCIGPANMGGRIVDIALPRWSKHWTAPPREET